MKRGVEFAELMRKLHLMERWKHPTIPRLAKAMIDAEMREEALIEVERIPDDEEEV